MGSFQSTPGKKEYRPSVEGFHGTEDYGPGQQFMNERTREFEKLQDELPNVIDDESRQQVEDYKQACDNGKGPVVACFATGEYLALFERKYAQAARLYENVCFRNAKDKSPNAVLVDGTMAYPPGCFNLAKMTMTGQGGLTVDNPKAYQIFDRACRGGHGGSCYLQAQILLQRPGSLGPGVPFDPKKAMELYERNCTSQIGDSISCFSLATMLLRGERISLRADNVSPQEARGLEPVQQRQHEHNRAKQKSNDDDEEYFSIPRDPARAEKLLKIACDTGSHITSCHNLAVMYRQGDEGVPPNPEKAEYYAKKTESMVSTFGGF